MRVLIVDDQRKVVEGLLGGISWKELGVEAVFPAYSAESARQVFGRERIDLLLADIEMPGENGLSLFRWVIEHYPGTECVFLTSHAEFAYAKEAISLGSFDYILQPARYSEIEDAVRRVRQKLERRETSQRVEQVVNYQEEVADGVASSYLVDLMQDPAWEEENLGKIFSLKLKREYRCRQVCMALLQVVHWQLGAKEWEGSLLQFALNNILGEIFGELGAEPVLLRYRRQQYVLLLVADGEEYRSSLPYLGEIGLQQFCRFEEQYLEWSSALYLGGTVEAGEFLEEFRSLGRMARQNVMAKSGLFVRGQRGAEPERESRHMFHMERWGSLLEQGRGAQIEGEIRGYFARPGRAFGEDLAALSELHCGFTGALVYVMQKRGLAYGQIFTEEYSLFRYTEAHDTYEHFLEAVHYVCGSLLRLLAEEEKRDPVELAVRYIRENLEKKLTREEVAEYLHLNREYLSRIFRERTGYTVKDFIMKEKLDLARELLTSTRMSVGIIALKTGFGNFSHFSHTFRRYEGVTPNEYRERAEKGEDGG